MLETRYPEFENLFQKFVQYIIDTERSWHNSGENLNELEKELSRTKGVHNAHWEPAFRLCTPCQAQFKVVVKVSIVHSTY